jgi:hypothetical protein
MSLNPNELKGVKSPSESRSFPTGIYPMGEIAPSGIFSIDAHENLIRSKGFKAKHFRHAYNPIRSTPAEGVDLKEMDLTGFNYYDPHDLYIAPQNLKWDDVYLVHGVFGKHTMVINHSGKYIDEPEKRVFLRTGDIITFSDDATTTVMMEDLFSYDVSGVQKLRFPVFSVDYLADSSRRYEEDVDFSVTNGTIVWNKANCKGPSFDPFKNQGTTFSCVYWSKPYFVVVDTPRVFRISWANDFANAGLDADATYFPGSAVLAMAWLHPTAKINNIIWPSQK